MTAYFFQNIDGELKKNDTYLLHLYIDPHVKKKKKKNVFLYLLPIESSILDLAPSWRSPKYLSYYIQV